MYILAQKSVKVKSKQKKGQLFSFLYLLMHIPADSAKNTAEKGGIKCFSQEF